MINIFEVFLPQLLRYPNPTDPLNGEAAALLMREPKSYEYKVKGNRLHHLPAQCITSTQYLTSAVEYVQKYASKDAENEADGDSEDDGEMSSVASYDSGDDEEPAGNMDEL